MISGLALLGLIFVSAGVIVSSRRYSLEETLRDAYGFDRDWWVPVIALILGYLLVFQDASLLVEVFVEKIDIIVLIFSFGVLSEGLSKSGFFTHISYRITNRINGRTSTLILSMFVLTSVVTFFTANDIVVLILTPIIIEICYQARLKNTKLILLSQFVAANTLSMGLLIGSPTNIIVAEQLGIDFFEYFVLMAPPALIAFGSSLVVLWFLIYAAQNDLLFSDLKFSQEYTQLTENPKPEFTAHMKHWLLLFTVFVVLVAVVTYLQISLLYCSVPSIILSLAYWKLSKSHPTPVSSPIRKLPFGIFFFGLSFFTLAEAFSRTVLFTEVLLPSLVELVTSSGSTAVAVMGVIGSGFVVNIFNDLPAAALIAQVFESGSGIEHVMFVQSVLVGLNIGTYVTQIGALAGLIWFNQIRVHRKKQNKEYSKLEGKMKFPSGFDLVRYGSIFFFVTAVVTAMFLVVYSGFVSL